MGPNPKTKIQTKVVQNPTSIMQSYVGPYHPNIISEKWVQILRQKTQTEVGQNPTNIMESYVGPNYPTIITEKWVQILRQNYKYKWVKM